MQSYKHHIIPLHEWKVRINPLVTRSDKVFNAPDNVVWLTLQQHIQAHNLLYELNHIPYDMLASRMLSGSMGKEELRREISKINGYARKGKKIGPASEEHRRKNSESHIGVLRGPHTAEHSKKIAMALTGTPHSMDRRCNKYKFYTVISPDGISSNIIGLQVFCRQHGLTISAMSEVSAGHRRHHKGWTCKYKGI